MQSFDHRYYPHIMDLIFDYADDETLPVLKQVCLQWQRKFDAEFAWLREFSAWFQRITLEAAEGGDHIFDEIQQYSFITTSARIVFTEELEWLGRALPCEVIDLVDYETSFESREQLRVNTLRIPYPAPAFKDKLVTLTPFVASRIVFDNNFRLKTRQDIKKLVINHRGDGFNGIHFSSDCTRRISIYNIVFIAHPTSHPSSERAADACANVIFRAVELLCAVYKCTYVAAEPSPLLAAFVAEATFNSQEISELEYLTLHQYRDKIGEREYAIETDFEDTLQL